MVSEISKGIAVNQQKSIETDKVHQDDTRFIPKKFKDIASKMEQQFAEYMINEMNKTVESNGSEVSDSSMDYYKGLLTSKRAEVMADQNNLGLQKVILDQIYPKRLRNEMALKNYERQAELIHRNLPSYKIVENHDKITMGKNESPQTSSQEAAGEVKQNGGLQ